MPNNSEVIRVTVIAEPLWHRVPGGTGVAARELLTGLSTHPEVEVDIVAARHRSGLSSPVGGRVRQVGLPRVLLYELWSRTGRPDVAGSGSHLIHSPMLPAPTASRVPVVVTLHDLAWVERPADFPPRARRLYERMFARVREQASLVLCSSEFTLRAAVAAGLSSDRARVVRLGARPLDSRGVDLASRFDIDSPFLLSVGTAEPRKNLARLLQAFEMSELWRTGMTLVLAGPEGWQVELGDLFDSLANEVRSSIVAVGQVSDSELAALYRGCAGFVYPSLLEGFGLPVLEALVAGAPVVTSATTATAEVAGEAALLVNPESVEEIAEAMRDIVEDDEARDRISRSVAGQVARHSWEAHIAATLAAYREVIT
ncbi:MAG: glycosyltransferase family 4 protein [Actinomycetia bacterium]|nr:glycosyltransferase family 4 protein [Actinomycetes bacterium]MCP4957882.1 glycosyltransferase family 4 protein [Actinomycetes bacterium]